MSEEQATETQNEDDNDNDNDDDNKLDSMTTDERLDAMQKQIDSMSYDITELSQALRNKSAMITRLSTEMEKLKKRIDINEEFEIEKAKQIREIEEKEIKEEMDKMAIPDLSVKEEEEKEEKDDENKINKKKQYRGYLLLWSGSSGYSEETYNKIQLMNLRKYKETNGKQKPYIFNLRDIENKFISFKKNIQSSSNFDRHWFGNDIITNNENIPKYIEEYIEKLNYNPMNNEYIKKLTLNVSSFQQRWNFKKLSFKKDNNDENKKDADNENDADIAFSPKIENNNKNDNNLLFNINNNYSMMFRCGGVYAFNKQRCSQCDITIFNHLHDNNIINGYTLNLALLPISTSLTSCKYNKYNGLLYCIGGDTDKDDVTSNIYELNLNHSSKKDIDLKWKKSSIKLYYARKSVNLCLIDEHNLMIIGGKSKSGEKLNCVELYVNTAKNIDIELNRYRTTKILSCLCLPRSASGCLLFNKSDKRVIIGGGWGGWNNDDTKKTMEWYDTIKNKWYLYPYKTNYEHQFSPILWNDPYKNENIIYIAGDCIGIDSKSMLGTIEWIDIRENKNNKKWNIWKNEKSLLQMFSLQNVDEKIWRSRSLMIS